MRRILLASRLRNVSNVERPPLSLSTKPSSWQRAAGLFGVSAAIVGSGLYTIPAHAQTAASGEDQKQQAAKKPQDQPSTIVVTGQRAATTRTPDSVIYNTNNNAQGEAGTAGDVLNTLPGVNVSGDGNVSLRGNNVQIYINGKPAASMQGGGQAATLQSMPGSSVASVEVITTPSAKYDANGGAIINLILKKRAEPGAQGTVSVFAGDMGRKNMTISGSYGAGKLSSRMDISLRDNVRQTRTFGERLLRSDDGSVVRRSVRVADYTPTHTRSLNVNGSLEYALSDSADLGGDFSLQHSSPKNIVYEHRADYDAAGLVTSEYDRVRTGVYYDRSYDASVYYQRQGADSRDSLKIVAQTGRSAVEYDRPFVSTFTVPQIEQTAERIYNRYVTRQQRLAADYDRPLGEILRLGLGAELKRDLIRQDNGHASIDPAVATDLSDPPILYMFIARQTTAAAYVTLQAAFDRWTLQAGERGQIVSVDARVSPATPLPRRRITSADYSFSVTRDVGAGSLSAKLNHSLQLFDPRDLNPLVTYIDPVTRSIGDPTLLPQKVTSAEAGYSMSKGARDASLSFYYKRVSDVLVDYNLFLPDDVQVNAKQNSGSASSYGVEASFSDKLTKKLKYSLTANLFHSTLPVLDENGVRQTEARFSYVLQGSLDWKPTSKDQVSLDATIQGPTLVPQGLKSGTSAVSLVWRHTLAPALTLSLSGQNIVQRHYVTTRIDTPTALDITRSLNGRRAFWLGLKYKFR